MSHVGLLCDGSHRHGSPALSTPHRTESLCLTRDTGISGLTEGLAHREGMNPDVPTPLELLEALNPADQEFCHEMLLDLHLASAALEPFAHMPKVTIFGSARLHEHTVAYRQVVSLASTLAANGYTVITGGGPGIMRAGLEGAGSGAAAGIAIRLPFEVPSMDLDVTIAHQHRFLTRKLAMTRHVRGFVGASGGLGTLDEILEVLTLLQTGHKQPTPVVLLDDGSGIWQSFDALFSKLAANELVSAPDRALYRIVQSPQEAFDHIRRFWSRYRGCDVLGPHTILRLAEPVTEEELAGIKAAFPDLSPATHEHGLAVDVMGKHFSRVRELIDMINAPSTQAAPAPADDGKLHLLKLPGRK